MQTQTALATTTSADINAAEIVQNLLEGTKPPPDVGDCGPWADAISQLYAAHEEGGTDAVRTAFQALTRADKRLITLSSYVPEKPLEGVDEEIAEILRPGCSGDLPQLPQINHASSLKELAPFVNNVMVASRLKARDKKRAIAHVIEKLLNHQHRLILDTEEGETAGTPYIVGDDHAIWPLHKEALPVRAMLSQAGLNFSESAFSWLVAQLSTSAYNDGPRVSLAHFWIRRNDVLYVSCGATKMVRAFADDRDVTLTVLPNGADGIYFASDTVLQAWEPETPVSPQEVAAFCPALLAPPEVPHYTPETQSLLFTAWMIALVGGVRPLPLLALIGDRGGGKTHTIRAVSMLTTGENPTTISADMRDLWTSAVSRPVLALDNVDSCPATWLPDLLAAAVTGVSYERRRLYTDITLERHLVKAAFAVSTRTAAFARPDVAERTLPLLTGNFADADRNSDEDLISEIQEKRAGVLTWLVRQAVPLLRRLPKAPTLPGRFVDFGRVVWAYAGQQAPAALRALQQAQCLTIGDADPLVAAILENVSYLLGDDDYWEGTPSNLVRELEQAGADLPRLGGGKAIARQLREAAGTFTLFGLNLDERSSGNNKLFTLSR
jgi:hypothetical protein